VSNLNYMMNTARSGFDRTLEAIEANIIELFGMVAEDLPAVTQAFLDGRGDMATALAQREQFVDALYRQVEELAGRELLLQAPVASDLRFLLSVLRIAPELERSHDLVMQLASHVGPSLAEELTPAARDLARRMGDLASAMWRHAADSWYDRNRSAASALAGQQEEMTALLASLAAELASGRTAIPATMTMTLVGRCYDRLGAHALNIARRVTYLAGVRE
jgi:phosphate transport system protein